VGKAARYAKNSGVGRKPGLIGKAVTAQAKGLKELVSDQPFQALSIDRFTVQVPHLVFQIRAGFMFRSMFIGTRFRLWFIGTWEEDCVLMPGISCFCI
jgi:hypothetical protein